MEGAGGRALTSLRFTTECLLIERTEENESDRSD